MNFGVVIQHCIPQRLLGRFIYHVARCRSKPIKRALISWFARHYRVNLAEAEPSDLLAYDDFNAFFSRALKKGERPLTDDPNLIVSPVDGTLTEHGVLDDDRLVQAKGMHYTLAELLGEEAATLAPFIGGNYATIYLAPHNYHRVHNALEGHLLRTSYIPGKRFSVNQNTTRAVRNLFGRNERVVLWFDSSVLVMVGALNVSSISTVTQGEIASGSPRQWHEGQVEFRAGDEVGRFNLGSTIVLLFARGAIEWDSRLRAGQSLRMGEPIGRSLNSAQT